MQKVRRLCVCSWPLAADPFKKDWVARGIKKSCYSQPVTIQVENNEIIKLRVIYSYLEVSLPFELGQAKLPILRINHNGPPFTIMNLSTLLFFLALAIFESSACLWSGLMESMQVEEDPKVHLERSLRIKQALVGCEPLVADQYDLSQRQGKTMLETVRHCNQDFKNGWM